MLQHPAYPPFGTLCKCTIPWESNEGDKGAFLEYWQVLRIVDTPKPLRNKALASSPQIRRCRPVKLRNVTEASLMVRPNSAHTCDVKSNPTGEIYNLKNLQCIHPTDASTTLSGKKTWIESHWEQISSAFPQRQMLPPPCQSFFYGKEPECDRTLLAVVIPTAFLICRGTVKRPHLAWSARFYKALKPQ